MRRVPRKTRKVQQELARRAAPHVLPLDDGTITTPGGIAMIQALIPLGLWAVEEALQAEVRALAGPRYAHHDAHPDVVRWGQQRGSVFVADQKLPITVPRVRDRATRCEVPLATYAQFQTPRAQDVGLFHRVLAGVSCREYHAAAEAVPAAFGLARSSVSRRFIRASAGELRRLMERRHDDAEWLVLVLDGKSFAGDQLVIALGVTMAGEKRILGLVQTASENRRVIASFLRELGERGFPLDRPLLAVIDGAKGLRAAVRDVFGDIPVQRCQWHKRENVVSYLSPGDQPVWRGKLQAAYAHASYADAKRALHRLVRELRLVNESAATSLEEGLEETLTLHRLNVFPELGVSFKTTNLIESVMSRLEARTARVTRWRTSDQKQRWCAAALWAMEKRFRRVKGCRHLHMLKAALTSPSTFAHAAA